MIDMNLIDSYIKESSLKMNEVTRKNSKRRIITFFESMPEVDFCDLTKSDLVEMFSLSLRMSRSSFHTYKTDILDFFRWMNEQGQCSEDLKRNVESVSYMDCKEARNKNYVENYFRDCVDLLTVMNDVFEDHAEDFDTFTVGALLTWSGVEFKFLPDLLKTDFDENEGTIFCRNSNEIISLPKTPAVILHMVAKYCNADSFTTNRMGGKTLPYKPSAYLFRSYKSPSYTKKNLAYLTNTVNKFASEYGKKFNWDKIFYSGLYYRIYQFELQNGTISQNDIEILKGFFKIAGDINTNSKKQSLLNKFEAYLEFKEVMYS